MPKNASSLSKEKGKIEKSGIALTYSLALSLMGNFLYLLNFPINITSLAHSLLNTASYATLCMCGIKDIVTTNMDNVLACRIKLYQAPITPSGPINNV